MDSTFPSEAKMYVCTYRILVARKVAFEILPQGNVTGVPFRIFNAMLHSHLAQP